MKHYIKGAQIAQKVISSLFTDL